MSDYSDNPINLMYANGILPTAVLEELRKYADEPVQVEGEVYGCKWTTEGLIIAALVARLGGKVTLTQAELVAAKGLVRDDNDVDGSITLTAHIL